MNLNMICCSSNVIASFSFASFLRYSSARQTFVASGLKANKINAFDGIHSVFTILEIGTNRQSDVSFLLL